jgi:transposase-like protein
MSRSWRAGRRGSLGGRDDRAPRPSALGGVPHGANVGDSHTPKTVQTELGPVHVKTTCDRQGSFEPQVLPKRVTRLAGLRDKVLGL